MLSTSFGNHFLDKLPRIVQDDVRFAISQRQKRTSATRENMQRFTNDAMKHALKWSPRIEDKFPFVDERTNAPDRPRFHSRARSSVELNHQVLMNDEALEHLAFNLTELFTRTMGDIAPTDTERGYLNALQYTFHEIEKVMKSVHINAPSLKKKHKDIVDAERELERAIRRCLDVDYLIRKFKFLRGQYIEFSQIALDRVGARKSQRHYVSRRSFARWRKKQIETKQFIDSMSVMSQETGQSFDLKDVVKRTTANPENRRIELVVRSRGDEERAIDLGYEGVFITWTLPSKYHRNSSKWGGYTPKEGHQNIMEQWKLARAWLKKLDIDWFGLRVAEPHKDGTPHAHLFLYVHPSQTAELIRLCEGIACNEDKPELYNKEGQFEKERRIKIERCDPAKGTATGYIIKYISKNINGAHMPETDAQEAAFSARAWASVHRIKQFSQSGAPSVGLWRQLRRATAQDTAFDEELEALREHADNSRWKGFCELGFKAKLAYEEKLNDYGDVVKRVIGIEWLGKVIETCSEHFNLVKTKDVKRLALALKKGGALPWSTENKCNQTPEKAVTPLEKALMDVTGWSVKGIQCLLAPLSKGAKVPIDKHITLSIQNGQLRVT
ncbi:replication endonuclease [Vibrio sp. YMD68]|uniref:replication endonuclease n=1 Tax=Vibrio sp. YMD68 TaxID=3042300 RepID=UPI00249B2A48|nr:replication endonuclease [Vibrio sp. YMD68]WGW00337.1 replication endonuclease [Vibrio sp. YMD68]WGW00982.1 replication endonuclease [Vibrio sp. YMD68]